MIEALTMPEAIQNSVSIICVTVFVLFMIWVVARR